MVEVISRLPDQNRVALDVGDQLRAVPVMV
jgi:hypothetical protein